MIYNTTLKIDGAGVERLPFLTSSLIVQLGLSGIKLGANDDGLNYHSAFDERDLNLDDTFGIFGGDNVLPFN